MKTARPDACSSRRAVFFLLVNSSRIPYPACLCVSQYYPKNEWERTHLTIKTHGSILGKKGGRLLQRDLSNGKRNDLWRMNAALKKACRKLCGIVTHVRWKMKHHYALFYL